MTIITVFLPPLIKTVLIEGIITWFYKKERRLVLNNFVCNLITNPLANIVVLYLYYQGIQGIGMIFLMLAIEIMVIISEMILYGKMNKKPYKNFIRLSIITNVGSFCIGLLWSILFYSG